MRITFKIIIALFLLGSVVLAEPAHAASGGGLLSQRTYDQLSDMHELLDKKQYEEALAIGMKLLEDVEGSEYETAVVKQNIAYIYIYQNKNELAARYLREAIAMDVFADHEKRGAYMALGQVYVLLEQYQKAVELLKPLVDSATKEAPGTIFIMLSQAYYQLGEYDNALPYVKEAIARSDTPKEDWYSLLLAIYFEKSQYRNMAELLETMIVYWPERAQYWQQLSSIYLELEENQKALNILALSYKQDMLKEESDWLMLAQLYLYREIPYKAAEVLTAGLEKDIIENTPDHYEALANALVIAREYEEAARILGKAASLSDTGELYLRQAQIYASQQKWNKVVEAVANAEDKGLKEENAGTAYLLQGMASVEEENYEQALRSFDKAKDYEKSEAQAKQWITYVRGDLMKLAQGY